MACCIQSLTARRYNVPCPTPLMREYCIDSLGKRHSITWSTRNSPSIRTLARKRNIFLEPGQVDKELTSLYSSAQFYDEEDDVRHEINENVDADLSAEDEGQGAAADKLPKPRKVKVQSADFIKSSVRVADCPPAVYPEFAVIGRSNVGKSSLINMLTGRNSLAMVSKTPGKTKCINHFLINKSWYLVDLPGYGYARTSKANVMGWNKFTREYFGERETLVTVFLLVDASIPPMELDLACAWWFAESEIPFTIVYTKLDKKKKGCPPSDENIVEFERRLGEKWEQSMLPPSIATSSKNGKGKVELLNHIAQLRALWNEDSI